MDTWITIRRRSLHINSVLYSLCFRRADDVTIDYTMRYNRDVGKGKVISNSLDIDFIHGDIHGRLFEIWRNINLEYLAGGMVL